MQTRQVVPQRHSARYVALSYVWGKGATVLYGITIRESHSRLHHQHHCRCPMRPVRMKPLKGEGIGIVLHSIVPKVGLGSLRSIERTLGSFLPCKLRLNRAWLAFAEQVILSAGNRHFV